MIPSDRIAHTTAFVMLPALAGTRNSSKGHLDTHGNFMLGCLLKIYSFTHSFINSLIKPNLKTISNTNHLAAKTKLLSSV